MEIKYKLPTVNELTTVAGKLWLKGESKEKFMKLDYDSMMFRKEYIPRGSVVYFYRALIPEIFFLENFYHDKYENVVYITDSGSTVLLLSMLFPSLKFLVYKMGNKNRTIDRRLKYVENVEIFKKKDIVPIANCVLICNFVGGKIMEKQKKYIKLIKPKKALVKFRIDREINELKYYNGKLLHSVCGKNNGTQHRMIIDHFDEINWSYDEFDKIIYFTNIKKNLDPKHDIRLINYVFNFYRGRTGHDVNTISHQIKKILNYRQFEEAVKLGLIYWKETAHQRQYYYRPRQSQVH